MSADGPLVLGFDTSGPHCAAVLLSGDAVVANRVEPMQKGQAERLMPLLEEVLAEAGVAWGDLTKLAVGTGPGNFTGTRIAVSAARGLALGLRIPSVGVSAFEATAFGHARPVAVTVPAPRGQVYVQRFGMDGAETPALCVPEEVGTDVPVVACLAPGELVPAMARIARDRGAGPRPAPLYVRPADAAPSREAPPVILS